MFMASHRTRCAWILTVLAGVLPFFQAQAAEKEKPIAELIEIAQKSRDGEEQIEAIRKLAVIKDDDERDNKVVDELLKFVNKSIDSRVRKAAIKTLGELQKNVTKNDSAKEQYRGVFITILKNKDENSLVRTAIAKVFKETLDLPKNLPDYREVFPILLEIAKNPSQGQVGLRRACLEALGEFGLPEALDVLIDVLYDKDVEIKEAAAGALAMLLKKIPDAGNKIPLPAIIKLVEMLKDASTPVDLRLGVMHALVQLIVNGNGIAKNAIPEIFSILDAKQKPEVAQENKLLFAAIEAFGTLGWVEAVEPLRQAYDAYSRDLSVAVNVRHKIIKALGSILRSDKKLDAKTAETAVNVLIKPFNLKKEKDLEIYLETAPDGRKSAIYAMGDIPRRFEFERKRCIDLLITLLKKEADAGMKEKIAETLELLTSVDFGFDWRHWSEWFDKQYPQDKNRAK